MLRFTKNKETLASELAVPDCFKQKKDHKSHEALVRAYVLVLCGLVALLYLQGTLFFPSHKGLKKFFDLQVTSNLFSGRIGNALRSKNYNKGAKN